MFAIYILPVYSGCVGLCCELGMYEVPLIEVKHWEQETAMWLESLSSTITIIGYSRIIWLNTSV